jgi:hypothetical protein
MMHQDGYFNRIKLGYPKANWGGELILGIHWFAWN